MKKQHWAIGGLILLFLVTGLTWAFYPRESKHVKKAQSLVGQMFDENVPEEQRNAAREEMRQMRENVPEDERREVFRAVGDQFRQRMESHMREFAELPEDQRDAFLDKDIDRMESMRKEFEKRRTEGGDREGRGRGPGFGGPDGGGRGDRPRTEEDREARRRSRLDNTTPEQRAYMMEYFSAVNERRKERGLEPFMPFGRGRGGRGGR